MSAASAVSRAVVGLVVCLAWGGPQTAGAATRQVFVTSTLGNGDLSTWAETELDGLDGADEICRARAAAASLPNAATYRAWISTSTTDAFCHLFGASGFKPGCSGTDPDPSQMGPWVRRDGSPFAATLDKMTGPEHQVYQPVLYDETGAAVPDIYFGAWTGTDENGVRRSSTCSDWSSSSGNGARGRAWSVGRSWTYDDAAPWQ